MAAADKPKKSAFRLIVIVFVVAIVLVVSGLVLSLRTPKAERFRRKGALLLQRGQGAAAVVEFRRALEIDPNHMDAREGLVRALAVKREYVPAFDELAQAETAGMHKHIAAFLRAAVLKSRAEYRMASAGATLSVAVCDDVLKQEIAPALELCQNNIAQHKDQIKAYSFLAELLTVKGLVLENKRRCLFRDTELAAAAKQQELVQTNQIIARDTMAELLDVKLRATAAWEKILQLDTNHLQARLRLAALALRGRVAQPERVRLLLEPLINQEPPNAAVIKRMAEAEHIAGNDQAALKLVRRLAKTERTHEAMLFEAEVLIALERWQEADTVLSKITDTLAQQPERIKIAAAFLHGKTLRKLKQPGKAANFLQHIFSQPNRTWAEARYELALALKESSLREQAIATLNQVEKDARVARVRNVREHQRLRQTVYAARMDLANELRLEAPARAARYAGAAFSLFPERLEALNLARECYAHDENGRDAINALVLYHIAWLGRGKTIDPAIAACRRELKQPNAPEKQLRRELARIYIRHGAYTQAAEEYRSLWKDHPDDLDAGLELGRLNTRLGAHDQALAVYQELRRAFPDNFAVISGAVTALLAKGEVDAAGKLLKPYSMDPKSRAAHEMILNVFLQQQRTDDAIALAKWQANALPDSRSYAMLGELLLRESRLEEARQSFLKAAKLDPENLAAYTLGLLELADGKNADAVRLFRNAAARFPDWFAGNLYLSLALQADGRPVEAENVIRNILRKAPADAAQWDLPHLLLAIILVEREKPDLALAESRKIVSIDFGLPEDREQLLALITRADPKQRSQIAADCAVLLAFRHAGLHVQARRQSEKLDKSLPGTFLPQCWLAQTLDKAQHFDQAINLYRKIAQAHPDSAFVRLALAKCSERAGDRVGAIKAREEALALVSGDITGNLHTQIAKDYEEEGQVDVAIENYKAAIHVQPKNVFALNNLAWLLATRRGDTKGALAYVEQAVLADKKHAPPPAVMDTMGWVYYLNGDYAKAVKLLERAKLLLGGNASVRYHLGMTYLKLDRGDEAKAELEQALKLLPDNQTAADIKKALAELGKI